MRPTKNWASISFINLENDSNRNVNNIFDRYDVDNELSKTKIDEKNDIKDFEIDNSKQKNIFSKFNNTYNNTYKNQQQKIEEINLENNNENILNKKKNKNFNNICINEGKENKSNEKIKSNNQNIQVTPPSKKNSYIKDASININEDNITKTDLDYNNNSSLVIKNINLKDDFTKKRYINKKHQSQSPFLSDILENLNIISPKNYFKIKDNILKIILNNELNISILFVNILYPIAINQLKYQPIYAKLCKDIDK